MTLRQQILKLGYPFLKFFTGLIKNKTLINRENSKPVSSFYSLSAVLNNGQIFFFNSLKGYKVLIVNTASNCGYTAQYAELEELHKMYKDELRIIAFPSNDFKKQEKGNDEEIATFCKKNYGVSFMLMQKSNVVGTHQNNVFNWLSDKNINGWCSQQPQWNFSKYLVDENGILMNYFAPQVSPLSEMVRYNF